MGLLEQLGQAASQQPGLTLMGADWGKIKTRGNVVDRRGDMQPQSKFRPTQAQLDAAQKARFDRIPQGLRVETDDGLFKVEGKIGDYYANAGYSDTDGGIFNNFTRQGVPTDGLKELKRLLGF